MTILELNAKLEDLYRAIGRDLDIDIVVCEKGTDELKSYKLEAVSYSEDSHSRVNLFCFS